MSLFIPIDTRYINCVNNHNDLLVMKTQKIQIKVPHKKLRAIELYGHGTPFKQKIERNRTSYTRKQKHKGDFE